MKGGVAFGCLHGNRAKSPGGFLRQDRFRIWLGCGERSGVREDVFRRPAREVQPGALREEAEAGLGQPVAAFADQKRFELLLEGMEVKHVRGRIAQLGFRQLRGALIG